MKALEYRIVIEHQERGDYVYAERRRVWLFGAQWWRLADSCHWAPHQDTYSDTPHRGHPWTVDQAIAEAHKDIERHRKHRGFVTTKTYLEVS